MIKRIPSRTSRSKGIKIKYVLQICLLVGVCFWLIYQVKHSHDKKEEFNEKEVKDSSGVGKLGRKDLHPHVTGLNKNDDPEDEEEEETKMGEELHREEKMKLEQEREEAEMMQREKEEEEREGEAKHEGEELERAKNEEGEREEELEEETKREELEGGEGDEEIDERDLEKLEGQADHDEDVNEEEEKEKQEEGEDKEAESTEGEDKTQLDQENSMEDQNQDAVAKNAHEAREEHYKADDASSAVTHDKPILSAESENVSMGHIKNDSTTDSVNVSNFTYNSTEHVNRDHDNLIVQPGQNLATEIVDIVNATSASNERLLANSEDNSHGGPKSSFSNDHSVPNNASTGVSTEPGKDANGESTEMSHPLKHDEAQVMESTQARDAVANSSTTKDLSNLQTTELEQSNSETSSDGRETDSSSNFPDTTENAGTEGRDNSSSSTHVESDVPNTNIKPEVTAEADISSGVSSTTKGAADDTHNETRETSDESGETDEKPGNSNANGKNENEGMRNLVDTVDSAIAKDVKENRIDLVTLPENRSGGVNDGKAEE